MRSFLQRFAATALTDSTGARGVSIMAGALIALGSLGAVACGASNAASDGDGAGGEFTTVSTHTTSATSGAGPVTSASSGGFVSSATSGAGGGDLSTSSGGADGEICGDGLDNNGDGMVDEGCSCTVGATQSCYTGDPSQAGVGACTWGSQSCIQTDEIGSAAWGPCTGDGGPSAEVCGNNVDDDCNGQVDETCPTMADCVASSSKEDFTALCRNWNGSKHDHVDDCYLSHQCAPGCVADIVNLNSSVDDADGELSDCSYSVSGDVMGGESIRVDCTYDNIDGVPTNKINFACTSP